MKTLGLTFLLVAAGSAAVAQEPDGKAVFDKSCKMCHGADGTPPAAMLKMMPTLPAFTAEFMASRSQDSVVAVLTNGTANGKKKPMKDKLTPEEMAAVAKYVRETLGKAGGSE
jgi:mono/diheme cytochrome c family protein